MNNKEYITFSKLTSKPVIKQGMIYWHGFELEYPVYVALLTRFYIPYAYITESLKESLDSNINIEDYVLQNIDPPYKFDAVYNTFYGIKYTGSAVPQTLNAEEILEYLNLDQIQQPLRNIENESIYF